MDVAFFTQGDYSPTEKEGYAEMLSNRKQHLLLGKRGFTLVELMVVAAIVAILSSVAIPAYINYVNRSKQSEAAGSLMTARLEMEEFFNDNRRYANTIQCLPSFVLPANTVCLSSCAACPSNVAKPKYYSLYVAQAATNPPYYQIAATRIIYAWAATDNLTISSSTDSPMVNNTAALKFSVFKWLFP